MDHKNASIRVLVNIAEDRCTIPSLCEPISSLQPSPGQTASGNLTLVQARG